MTIDPLLLVVTLLLMWAMGYFMGTAARASKETK